MKIALAEKPIGQVVSISGLSISIEIKHEHLERSLEIEEIMEEGAKSFFIGIVGDEFIIGGPSAL